MKMVKRFRGGLQDFFRFLCYTFCMQAYIDVVQKVLTHGVRKENRTGTDALSFPGILFEHDMGTGFPLLTTKRVPLRLVASELEFFIRGLTDKAWLTERNNHIWDEWCSPEAVPYAHDDATKARMKAETNLGPIYGAQWRNFGGVDQLASVVHTLKTNPDDRRMIVSAWNPPDLPRMALPPCHYAFQLTVTNGRLNLLWNQRSVDVALGLPFNIASYALLLHLLAKEANLQEGRLVGFLADTHIYVNHVEALKTQIARAPKPLPRVATAPFTGIFHWTHTDTKAADYAPWPAVPFEIAV
jgi:thymidylate synthase